ncbi:MAG TPA: ectonucleotide pyrophosphatase/phosphodiesterase [Blastocatellia bacterium]|nr:ectonucleotide pyrophosphatase/phosphodiesterase [Blastocatellia bacterium]
MKYGSRRYFAAFLPFALLLAVPLAKTAAPRTDSHVIMISVDGLVPEYYTSPAQLGLKVPTLVHLKLGGAYADGVEGVYPSVTYPAHTTLVTGVHPATHGIVQNRIFEAPPAPQTKEWYFFSKDLKSETLWTLAGKAGLSTAAVGWPVTVGAEIDYLVPEIWDPAEMSPTPKRSIQYSTPGLLEKALASTSKSSGDASTDARRTAISEFVITAYKPNLMLIHLVDLDTAHHKFGPRSPEAMRVIERQDGYIARIIEATRKAGIFEQTTFFIVSDHGFAPVEKRFNPNVLLVKEKMITLDASGKPTDWKAAAWPSGGSCAIVLKDPNDKETAARVAKLFADVAARNNSPVNRVLNQDQLKRLGAIPSALLMLDAAPGFVFEGVFGGQDVRPSTGYKGTHGQLPSRAEMRSSLIIYGAGARVGARAPLVRMIDIGPTGAGLLNLIFPAAEGKPIEGLVKPGLLPKVPPPSKAKPASGAPR